MAIIIILCQLHMQEVEYTFNLNDQPIILSKCEVVSLTAAAPKKGLWLVDSRLCWLLYSVKYTCR